MRATYLNKTREVLNYIAARSVVTSSEIAAAKSLLRLYAGASTATPRRRLIDTCGLLAKQGYISVGMLDGEKVYKINLRGQQKLRGYRTLKVDIVPRFQGRWYLVTFDVPESHKVVRNQLILTLKRHGFRSYTKGVWVLPYDPAELMTALRKHLGLKKELRLIVATQLDQESELKRKFGI